MITLTAQIIYLSKETAQVLLHSCLLIQQQSIASQKIGGEKSYILLQISINFLFMSWVV